MYSIDGPIVTEYLPDSEEAVRIFRGEKGRKQCLVDFPMRFNKTTFEELEHWRSMNRLHTEMGVVLFLGNISYVKDKKLSYETVRHLRGNQPKLQYQYLELRTRGVEHYLKHFPANRQEFARYENSFIRLLTLCSQTIMLLPKKEAKLSEFPYQFKPHMYALHQLFVDEFKKGNKFYVSFAVVKEYVNNLHLKLMYALNWHTRKTLIQMRRWRVKNKSSCILCLHHGRN